MSAYNPFSLAGKTIFVTGASSGIGKAIAIECSKMGAIVIINGRNEGRLQETFTLLEGTGHVQIAADLSNKEHFDQLIDKLPNLDGLVHCAGISGHQPISFVKEDYLRDMFEINFFSGALLITKALKNKKLNKNSSIVFITSTSGVLGSFFGGSVYSATKGAVSGFIKGIALDLSSKKIRVNSVMPAMVSTPIMEDGRVDSEQLMEDAKKYPLKRYGKPEEVAYAAVYLLSEASAWTTGTNILLDGGKTISY